MGIQTPRLPQTITLEADDMGRLSGFLKECGRLRFFPDKIFTSARPGRAVIMEVTDIREEKYGYINGYMEQDGAVAFVQAPYTPAYEADFTPDLPALADIQQTEDGRYGFSFEGNRQQFFAPPEWGDVRIGPAVITQTYRIGKERYGMGIVVPMTVPDIKDFVRDAIENHAAAQLQGMYFYKLRHPVLGEFMAYNNYSIWCATGKFPTRYALAWTDNETGETAYQTLIMSRRIAADCTLIDPAVPANSILINDTARTFINAYQGLAPKFLDKYPKSRLQWETDNNSRFSKVMEEAIADEIFHVTRPVKIPNAKNLPFLWFNAQNAYRLSAYTDAEIKQFMTEVAAVNGKTDETLYAYIMGGILARD